MNFQTSEEIRRINIALDSLRRRVSSKILDKKRKKIDPIFRKQIINSTEETSVKLYKEVIDFEKSSLMQSTFGKTFIKGWIKKPIKSIWKRWK